MRMQKCFNLNLILSGENSFWENYRHIQVTGKMLTRYFPTAIIRTIINKALKRRVHVTDVQREP